MRQTTYRTAVLGCGGRGREHLHGLIADPRVEIVALADVNPDSAASCAADFKLQVPIYEHIDELLEKEKPEIVVVALWTKLHLPVIRACAKAGVRLILAEKPIATRWDESLEIGDIVAEYGVILTLCHQRRFASGNLAVRKLLDSGHFGKIDRMDLYSPPHLLDCGTHSVDQAMSFNKESPGKWVLGGADLSSTVSYFDVPAEGEFFGLIAFENGVQATIRCAREEMTIWGGIRVFGEMGWIEVMWDGQVRRATLYHNPSWVYTDPAEEPHEQMIGTVRNAIDAMESGEEPELSYRKALRAAEVLFGLYESNRIREKVTLPLPRTIGNPLHDMLVRES